MLSKCWWHTAIMHHQGTIILMIYYATDLLIIIIFIQKNNKHLKRQNRSCRLWTAVQCRWLPLSFCLNGRHPLWHLNWLRKRENASCWHFLSLSKDAVNIFPLLESMLLKFYAVGQFLQALLSVFSTRVETFTYVLYFKNLYILSFVQSLSLHALCCASRSCGWIMTSL